MWMQHLAILHAWLRDWDRSCARSRVTALVFLGVAEGGTEGRGWIRGERIGRVRQSVAGEVIMVVVLCDDNSSGAGGGPFCSTR